MTREPDFIIIDDPIDPRSEYPPPAHLALLSVMSRKAAKALDPPEHPDPYAAIDEWPDERDVVGDLGYR